MQSYNRKRANYKIRYIKSINQIGGSHSKHMINTKLHKTILNITGAVTA